MEVDPLVFTSETVPSISPTMSIISEDSKIDEGDKLSSSSTSLCSSASKVGKQRMYKRDLDVEGKKFFPSQKNLRLNLQINKKSLVKFLYPQVHLLSAWKRPPPSQILLQKVLVPFVLGKSLSDLPEFSLRRITTFVNREKINLL